MPDYLVLFELTERGASDVFNVLEFIQQLRDDWTENSWARREPRCSRG